MDVLKGLLIGGGKVGKQQDINGVFDPGRCF